MLSISTFIWNIEPAFIKIEASLNNGSYYCAACVKVNALARNIELEYLSAGTNTEKKIDFLSLYKTSMLFALLTVYRGIGLIWNIFREIAVIF